MGQKVHPIGFRLGVSTEHTSKWYAEGKEYPEFLLKDLMVKDFLKKKLSQTSVSKITIERPSKAAEVTIHTARPGIVIGKKGEDVEILRKKVASMMDLNLNSVKISNIEEIRKPEINAQLVAEGIASQLERRIMYRRAMKKRSKLNETWRIGNKSKYCR